MTARWFPSLAGASGVSAVGYRAGALTGRAALVATAVGAAILRGGGLRGGTLLAAFFISGSALPRLFSTRRQFASDSARNERQVVANGGAAACAAVAARLLGHDRGLVGIAGSLAAATADTWATEIGSTSKQIPRLILSREPIRPGLSGGVTRRGNAGATGGALLIALLTLILMRDRRAALAVFAAGLAGATVDSVLGEIVQARYLDAASGEVTESPTAGGRARELVGGRAWIDNDVVNFACTFSGAIVAMLVHWASGGSRLEASTYAGCPPAGDPPSS